MREKLLYKSGNKTNMMLMVVFCFFFCFLQNLTTSDFTCDNTETKVWMYVEMVASIGFSCSVDRKSRRA